MPSKVTEDRIGADVGCRDRPPGPAHRSRALNAPRREASFTNRLAGAGPAGASAAPKPARTRSHEPKRRWLSCPCQDGVQEFPRAWATDERPVPGPPFPGQANERVQIIWTAARGLCGGSRVAFRPMLMASRCPMQEARALFLRELRPQSLRRSARSAGGPMGNDSPGPDAWSNL